MSAGRIVLIPFLHGKIGVDGTVVEPDIEAILEKWLERHPEFRDPKRDVQIIRGLTYVAEEGLTTALVRVTAEFSPDVAGYDPVEDADLYQEFLAENESWGPPEFHKIWIQQCKAAEQIEADYGTEKAMGYLIGEKLLTFLEVAETKPEWRAEIPQFVAKIKEIFADWQIGEYFETARRLGALGHTADDEAHDLIRSQLEESEKLREDARNLLLFEWARQLLTEGRTN
jgi:hypothetical protein